MSKTAKFVLTLAMLGLCSAPALAHPGHGIPDTLAHGFVHPLGGIDHVLAMISVGVLAFAMGGRAVWALPIAFIAMMTAGGALGASAVNMPALEQSIATSVVVLGIMVVFAARVPLSVGVALAGLFAVFHGVAHGLAGTIDGQLSLQYFAGFLLATGVLLGAGTALGGAFSISTKCHGFQRGAGLAVGLTGLMILVS